MIRITASNGKTTTAKVVDDVICVPDVIKSMQVSRVLCRNNNVDGSAAVGLDKDLGVVPVTCSMA